MGIIQAGVACTIFCRTLIHRLTTSHAKLSIDTVPISARIASTAAPSPPIFSPRPTHRPAAIAAASVTRTNSSAVQLTNTLASWQQTGRFGDGIRVGVIDDGIDYTHADFGGPGTPAAYQAVDRTKVDASYFPKRTDWP